MAKAGPRLMKVWRFLRQRLRYAYPSVKVALEIRDEVRFSARSYAGAYIDRGIARVAVSAELNDCAPERIVGVLAHELGHVMLLPAPHSEEDADRAALERLNIRISYDSDTVQTAGVGGKRPKWLHQ